MALDIVEGDILVVGANEYPIRSCAEWAGFAGLPIKDAIVSCSTKRSPAIAGGKRGTPAANLVGLLCTPLDPVDPDLRRRMELDTPHELLQTFIQGTTEFVHLVLEDLKR